MQNDQNNKEKDLSNIEHTFKIGSPSSHDNGSNIIKISNECESPKKEISNAALLKKFKDKLDEEIKKVYVYFAQREREIYVLINSHLHIKNSYETFSLSNLKKEIIEIKKISSIALNLSKFIHLNMTAIKKILKKFDKNFSNIYGRITLPYIQKKLDLKHSDLLYILNLKIIDEVSAIIEELMKELKCLVKGKSYEKARRQSRGSRRESDNIINNEDFEKHQYQDRLMQNENEAVLNQLNDISRFFLDLEENIYLIDELNHNFRNSFKEWTFHLKNMNKAYNNGCSILAKTSILGIPNNEPINSNSSSLDNLQKYNNSPVSSEIYCLRKKSIESEILFTTENLNNIFLTMSHSFMFMFAYSIVIPTNCILLGEIGEGKYYSGLALGMTPLGTIFSLFLAKKAADHSFKKPLIFSILLFILSAVLYILASTTRSYTLILISRFILGLGSFRYLNRTYFTLFIGRRKISKYMLIYQIWSMIGLASGPLFSIPLSLLGESQVLKDERLKNIFNVATLPAWLLLILNSILLLLVIVYYFEPLDISFMAFRDGLPSDARSVGIDRDRLSLKDKNMIDHIDFKLNEINESNKFSDTNLVNRFIQQIAWKESNSNSYLYKCFLVFVILLIIVRVKIKFMKKNK